MKSGMYVFKLTLGFMWAIPWTTAGLLLCLTIIGVIPGMICFGIGAAPLAKTMKTRVRQEVKYQFRDHPLYEEEELERPWEQ